MRDPLLVPRLAAAIVGPLVAAGEVVRRLGDGTLIPGALDEIVGALLLVLAAAIAHRDGGRSLYAAWAFYAGLMLVALLNSLAPLLAGDPFASRPYTLTLAALFAGASALALSLRRGPDADR